jgi:nucleoside-diphosphate-sugar epimerase
MNNYSKEIIKSMNFLSSKKELCFKIKEIVGDFELVLSEIGKDIDKRDYIVSNEKVEKRGFCPKYTLEDGINELVKFY